MKKCDHCKQLKEDEDFNWRFKSLGIRAKTCRECMSIHQKKYFSGDSHDRHLANVKERKDAARLAAREYVYEYLLTHHCSQCGESDPRVLEFHHQGEKTKAVSVLVAAGYSIETIQREIDSCTVLCANCHRKVTMSDRGWFRGRK